jgi:uncharacterized membrane protein YdjX (TVP38/TMEM64 family)
MIENISDFLETFLLSLGVFAPILACFLIVIESILPVLPLCVFITINFYFFGKFVGFLLSWIFTCIGCYLSYVLVKKGVKTIALDTAQKSGLLQKTIKIIKNMDITNLILVIAIPFTPAFLINIAAAIANIDKKKFIISILIGKIFMVYFWGFIGTTLVESITDIGVLLKIAVIILIAFILSKIVTKKFNIN